MPSQDTPQDPPSVPPVQQGARQILKKSNRKLSDKVPERIKKEKILIKILETFLPLFQNHFSPDPLTPFLSSLIKNPRTLNPTQPTNASKAKLECFSQPQPLPADTQIFIQELIKTASTKPTQIAQTQKAKDLKSPRKQAGFNQPQAEIDASAKQQSQRGNISDRQAQNAYLSEDHTGVIAIKQFRLSRAQSRTLQVEARKAKKRSLKKQKPLPPVEEAQASAKKVWLQRLKLFLVPAIAALIGVVLILYPVVATRHNNAHQRHILENYRVNLEANNASELENALKRADEYNHNLAEGKITDPFLVDIIPDSYEYQSYLQQLNVSGILGQVVIPSIRANLPIYHGTEDHTLQKGVGHLFGSSLPVGGKDTHSILTGHSGLASATMFDNLHKVEKGDKIFLNVSGRKLQYGVIDIKVVLPDETDSLVRQTGKDLLTLITCTPYGINSHRLFVTAEREHPVEEKILNKELNRTDPPWETWMIVLIIIAVSGGGLISLMLIHSFWAYRKRKEEKEDAEEEQESQQEEPQEAEAQATEAVKDPAPIDLDAADTGALS